MNDTSASLLQRLRQPEDEAAWRQFVRLYAPLLYHWAWQRMGLQSQDAADLVQDVFVILVRKLPEFAYDPRQRFRGWLWTVVRNQWLTRRRHSAPDMVPLVENDLVGPDGAAEVAEEEYRRCLVQQALRLMQAEFEPTTWKACWESVVAGRPAAAVAAELGITANAVYIARSRVTKRLRDELRDLLD
jgi:RNA polymerase sigma-70 factor (ECF subfamily)